MGVNIWVNRRHLYLDVYHKGIRRREKLFGLVLSGDKATDKETMRLAEIARAKRAQQIFSEEMGLVDPVAGKQSLYSYIEKSLKEAKHARRKSINTVLKHLKDYHGGGCIQLSQISGEWLKDFQDFLLKKLEPSSVKTYFVAIRAALSRAVKERILTRNPATGLEHIKVPESDVVWLGPEEVQKLAETPLDCKGGEDIRRAFIFACYTGLRISDLTTLAWGDIQHSPLQITKRTQKTGVKAYIPLNASAWAVINDGALHDYRDAVFPALAKANRDYKRLRQWATAAGIQKHIGWHTARHTFAVLSLEGGAGIYTLSKLLGHTSLETTQIYAKVTDKLKRQAVDGLPEIKMDNPAL